LEDIGTAVGMTKGAATAREEDEQKRLRNIETIFFLNQTNT
jgi:hypothetical protein